MIVNVRVGLRVLPLAFAAALSACGRGSAPTYTVSGNVTGSKSPFALQDGAANEIQVAANGPLNLASSLANGASYAFTVKRLSVLSADRRGFAKQCRRGVESEDAAAGAER